MDPAAYERAPAKTAAMILGTDKRIPETSKKKEQQHVQ
jgi:hypothetical protein